MSHEDTLLIVDAIHSITWAVLGVVFVLAFGLILREIRGAK